MTGGGTGTVRSAQPLADFSTELMEAGGENKPRPDETQGVDDPDGRGGREGLRHHPDASRREKAGSRRGRPSGGRTTWSPGGKMLRTDLVGQITPGVGQLIEPELAGRWGLGARLVAIAR